MPLLSVAASLVLAAASDSWHKVQASQGDMDARRASNAINLTARSTGRENGAIAEFFVDGQKLTVSTGRGMNVAVISSSGVLESFQVFDTHGAGSDALEVFFGNLAPGAIVMMAARDEAQGNISDAAVSAIKTCGATLIEELKYRGAYALIGIKNGLALAEESFPDLDQVAVATAMYAPTNSFEIMLTSTGRDLGNTADFHINGVQLNLVTTRGLCVAVMNAGGTLNSFNVFDTHAADSEALVSFIGGLADGTLVLVAARDDVMSNLTRSAEEAIEDCGATMISSLTYRSGYALIGVKGGVALAEALGTNGVKIASITATYSPDKVVLITTTTTTTTLAPCFIFDCPKGFGLKMDPLSINGSSVDECCDEKPSADLADVGVRSAGFADGNEAIFFAGGKVIFTSSSRGLTVVTVRPDGTRESSETFDTMKDGSDALVAYLNSLENGTMVLIGAKDEASANISDAAIAAIEGLGATQANQIGWRSAYALVGVKGGAALAEMAKPTNQGYAIAVAEMTIVLKVDNDKPVCDARVAKPPVMGYVSNGNLELEAGCRYRLFEREHATACLHGSWTMITGSSNTLLEFGNLINMLAPAEYHIQRPGESIGASAVADVIIENGVVTYWDVVSNQLPECRQVDKAIAQENDAACRTAITELLDKAPAYSSTAIRITMFISFFWDRTGLALDVVSANEGWSQAKVSLVSQVGAWYNVCSVTKEEYCPRAELLELDRDPAIEVFKEEMEEVAVKLESFCGPGGRAGELGCNIQTISWTNGQRDNENFGTMNAIMEELFESRLSPTLRFVDFFNLGGAMPEEVVNGHGSQMLNLWAWTVMFNAMCPGEEQAAEGSYAVWEGAICSGTDSKYENCPEYYPSCLDGPRCERWECMNSVPCTLVAEVPPMATGSADGMCNDVVNISSFIEQGARRLSGEEATEVLCYNARGLRNRLWCQDDVQWLLPLIFVLLALAVLGWPMAEPRLRKALGMPQKQAPEKPAAVAPKEAKKAYFAPPTDSANRDFVLMTGIPPPLVRSGPSSKSIRTEPGSPACTESDAVALDIAMDDEELFADLPKSKSDEDARKAPTEEVTKPNADLAKDPEAAAITPETTQKDVGPEKAEKPKWVRTRALQTLRDLVPPPLSRLRAAGNKYPLGLARFAASTHIVCGHMNAKDNVIEGAYFYGWGFTWVPWFFMLSGFVLFSAHLKNPKPESMFQYVMRRSVTIYPLYAVSLIPSFAFSKALGTLQAGPGTLVAQSFLLQAWWPGWTERALQMHCWFLSCMVVYWFFFKPLAYCLKNLNLLKTISLMAFLFFLPWLLVFVPLIAQAARNSDEETWADNVQWYNRHQALKIDTALDFGVVMLKFNPICYMHVFVLGMLLARLRVLLDPKAVAAGPSHSWRNPWNIALQFIAPLGYLFLILVFSVKGFQAQLWGYKLSSRLSVLLPFQAMVLFGLAGLPSLPLPFFSYAFSKLDFLETYSFSVYVFQFLLYSVWPQKQGISLPLFLIFTYSFAVVATKCVQQPVQKWWSNHTTSRFVVPCVLAACLAGLSFLPNPTPVVSQLPDELRINSRALDVRLDFQDPEGEQYGAAVINPSILIHDNKVVIVARRHWMESDRFMGTYDGTQATIMEEIWHSDILMGSTDLDAEAWAKWPLEGSASASRRLSASPLQGVSLKAWTGLQTPAGSAWDNLCVKEKFIERNNTLIRLIVTGPEDPKVISQSGSLTFVFDSLPPSEGNVSTCRRNANTGALDAVTQMYIVGGVDVENPTAPSRAYRLTYGNVDAAEKNWIPFTKDGSLHFVYQPVPHTILNADVEGSSEKKFSTTFKPLNDLMKANPSIEVRGSGDAVFINDPVATPSMPRAHYLALLHLHDANTGRYAHYAYRFSAEAPFIMLQLSTKLPLLEAEPTPGATPFAFASGLVLQNRTVAILYGAGDRESRAQVWTLDALDELFSCSNYADV